MMRNWMKNLPAYLLIVPLSILSSSTVAQSDLPQAPSPLYLKVMQQWASATNFALNASEIAVNKFVHDLKKDPQVAPFVTTEMILDLKQFFYELFISQETMGAMASIYSEYFSIDDLQELIKFYQTPVGKKLISTRADISNQTQKLGDQLLKARERDFIEIVAKHINRNVRGSQQPAQPQANPQAKPSESAPTE